MSDILEQESQQTKAVVLLSGGMDSTTLLYFAKKIHGQVYALIFDYGQRHRKEIEHAERIAKQYDIEYTIHKIKIPKFDGSPLVDQKTLVPGQDQKQQKITVVPLRNSMFLIHACAFAVKHEAEDVYIGAVQDDQEAYPDCRPEFFRSFQELLEVQELNLHIRYPFVNKDKTKIVEIGEKLGVPWDLTWTCYVGQEKACGKCDACLERLSAFHENNLSDPIQYV